MYSYDVIVAGGGVAGVAAALEAARCGMKTALLEKTVFAGGLATTGLVNIYLPLCDGKGRQVIFGIAEELLKASILYGPGEIPEAWAAGASQNERVQNRYLVTFNPASFIMALDELLSAAGVDIWFDTLVCGAMKNGNTLTGVEVETKSGRLQMGCRCAIDATGDADIAWLAGAECATGKNYLAMWTLDSNLDMAKRAVEAKNAAPLMRCVPRGSSIAPDGPPDRRIYSGVDARDVTALILDGRKMLREEFAAAQSAAGPDGRNQSFPMVLPAMAQFRMTRRIDGMATLTDGDDAKSFADSVAISGDWRRPGPVWEIPYGCLVPRGVEGLLAAGRCISTEGDAWDALRVIPPAALTGQVAGLAASLAIKQSISPHKLNTDYLRENLQSRGILCRR